MARFADLAHTPTMVMTLHTMNPRERFTGLAGDYARHRPSYPDEVIGRIVATHAHGAPIIADIGTGTGISASLLAAHAGHVIALDPNPSMLRQASPHWRITWIQGGAESLPLKTGSIDIVTAFQAFHWFDPVRALPEMHRVLRPGGHAALVWHDWNFDDPFTAGYASLIRKASHNHPAEDRVKEVGPFLASPLFGEFRQIDLPYRHRLDLGGLLGRLRSTSYVPQEGDEGSALVEAVTDLYSRHADAAGVVAHVYVTRLFLGTRVTESDQR